MVVHIGTVHSSRRALTGPVDSRRSGNRGGVVQQEAAAKRSVLVRRSVRSGRLAHLTAGASGLQRS